MSSLAAESLNSPFPHGLDEDLPCPQCQYNLRGLMVPRCPECGFAFHWSDLPSFRAKAAPSQAIPRWVTTLLVVTAGMVLTFSILTGEPGVGIWITFFLSVIVGLFFAVSGTQAAIEMVIAWPVMGKMSWTRFRAWWEGVLIGYGLCAVTCGLAGHWAAELLPLQPEWYRGSNWSLGCLLALTALESFLVQWWVVQRRAHQWHDPIARPRLLRGCLLAKAFIAVVWTLIVMVPVMT